MRPVQHVPIVGKKMKESMFMGYDTCMVWKVLEKTMK